MEFIKVTLHQSSTSLQHGEKFSDLQQFENYLLPIAGIKYIEETQTEPGIYHIEICESHRPTDLGFEVGYAKAKLSKSFFNVVN